jgi:hypothetical protein
MENTNLPPPQKQFGKPKPTSGFEKPKCLYKIKEFDKMGYLVMPICNSTQY